MTLTTLIVVLCGLGVLVGTMSGLLGIGGGLVVVPALLWILPQAGIEPEIAMHMALATSLASIILTSSSSAYNHYHYGNVHFSAIKWLLPGVIAGGFIGSTIAESVPTQWLPRVFGVIVMFLALKMLRSSLSKAKPPKNKASPRLAPFHGALIGMVSSLAGIGGGSLMVPYLNRRGEEIRVAIGSSAACGVIIAIAGMLGFVYHGASAPELPSYSVGYVYLPALISIAATSVLFTKFGAKLATRLPTKVLKRVFALFLLSVAIKMLFF